MYGFYINPFPTGHIRFVYGRSGRFGCSGASDPYDMGYPRGVAGPYEKGYPRRKKMAVWGVARLQGVEGSGMVGLGKTLGSPWMPLAVRAWGVVGHSICR
jgi:hypothetical protein